VPDNPGQLQLSYHVATGLYKAVEAGYSNLCQVITFQYFYLDINSRIISYVLTNPNTPFQYLQTLNTVLPKLTLILNAMNYLL
jgi:hypothetical protein